ncbi:hypothetical protein T484DRAFT_1769370 [Baffinella frigidus]|nr:hypothetical protein T484DRAFT_1769370 [Cryptophyta sp. CCMP2293]
MLGDDLLLSIWPAARITLGMRVNRWLNSVLRQAPQVTLVAQSDGGGGALTAQGLRKWRGDVAISAQSYSAGVFDAVVAAVGQGWHGLRALDLCNNNIGADGARKLPAILLACVALESLRLDHNHITDEGATTLAQPLYRGAAPNLRALSLAYNGISAPGTAALARALPSAPRLAHLDLSGNALSDEGARALCVSLPLCPALAALLLTHNEIGLAGASSLALTIPRCPALSTLVSPLTPEQVHLER